MREIITLKELIEDLQITMSEYGGDIPVCKYDEYLLQKGWSDVMKYLPIRDMPFIRRYDVGGETKICLIV